MIEPLLKDDALLADIHEAPAGALSLWWLGQSGFLLKWKESYLLVDPYLSDSLTRKYSTTDKPHVRMSHRVIAPERLGFVDAVTSSHNHTDHLDAETVTPILAANPRLKIVVAEANLAFAAERLGVESSRLCGMDAGDTVTVGAYSLHAAPSSHEALDRDDEGHYAYLGYIIEAGPWRVYHSGDTVRYDGMVEWLSPWRMDVALLPINGALPERRVAGNLSGPEAARLAHEIGAGLVVPCHYHLFEFNTAEPDEFVAEANRLNQPHRVLQMGERLSLAEPKGALQ